MEKYQKLKKLGSGSFGNVELAENKQTKQIVAIKQLKRKYGTWDQCLQLSQVKALRKMSHPNVIKLKQLVRVGNDAHLVFEYIEKDVFKLITERKEKGKVLEDQQIRHITKQMVQAIGYVHKLGFFHRDLKPENVLIDQDFNIKLIDFGIAKQVRSKPPFTEYVATRWYRAPEILFKFPAYSAPVDVFALGCIVAQMYLMKPLFQGNSQMDQISKITSVLGTPKSWPQGQKQAVKKGINLPEYNSINLQTILDKCPPDGVDFIIECLRWQPSKRITTTQMLDHPYIVKARQNEKNFKQQLQGNNNNNSSFDYLIIKKQSTSNNSNNNSNNSNNRNNNYSQNKKQESSSTFSPSKHHHQQHIQQHINTNNNNNNNNNNNKYINASTSSSSPQKNSLFSSMKINNNIQSQQQHNQHQKFNPNNNSITNNLNSSINQSCSPFISTTTNNKNNSQHSSQQIVQKSKYKGLQNDLLFEQLLNNFEGTKIGNNKQKISKGDNDKDNKDDDDQWN